MSEAGVLIGVGGSVDCGLLRDGLADGVGCGCARSGLDEAGGAGAAGDAFWSALAVTCSVLAGDTRIAR